MDIELLRKVAQYTMGNLKTPTQIKGYSDEEVKDAVSDLVSKGVISVGTAIKYSPANGNYTIKEGNAISVENGEKVCIATVFEYQFEKHYGEKLF